MLCAEADTRAAVIITQPFQALVRLTASKLGAGELPVQVLEHPIFTRDDAWVERTADEVAASLAAKLLDRPPVTTGIANQGS